MGTGQQKPASKTENDDLPKINHEVFGNRQVIKTGNDEETILVKVSTPSQRQYNTWVQKLTKVGQNQALLLPKSYTFNKQGFCGTSGTVDIYYENYPFLLSDQINNRQSLGTKFFEENQLWYLVLTLLSSAEYFHAQKKKVGDIRPQNIFISEDGSVKVACNASWPMERNNYQKSFEKHITYLSPEEVNEMSFGKTQPSSLFDLSQTFSIGLTLLDASTLSDSTDLYKGQKSFNFELLEERLRDLNGREEYSILLKGLITNMCDANPDKRTPARQLFEWLSPFEEEINNFENFETHELPDKLRAEIERTPIQNQPPPPPPPPPQPVYPNNYNNNTYVNSHYSFEYKGNPPPALVPVPVKTQYKTYIPPPPTVTPPAVRTSAGVPGVGFSYQATGSTSLPPYMSSMSNPKPIIATEGSSTIPGTYPSGSSTIPPQSTTIQSTYVTSGVGGASGASGASGAGGRFSLDKIDQQLQQSRKMFPS